MQKQYEIVAIYQFLLADFVSWDKLTILKNCTPIGQKLKMLNWFQCQFRILKVQWFEVQEFDFLNSSIIWLFEYFKYLIIWIVQLFDLKWPHKNVEFKLKFSLDNGISSLIQMTL